MSLLIVIAGILLLFALIAGLKLNSFLSFIIVCLFVGLLQGMEPLAIIDSIQKGIGSTLGFLVLILGLGAMLGKLVADSGAAQRITTKLVDTFGIKHVQWAVVLTGFIVGIPMFYSVGFVILVPLAFTIAATTRLPLLYVGLPMLTSLSVTHGYLPPHPAPTAIATMFNADFGKTLMYGLLIAVPAIIVAGPFFARTIKNIEAKPLAGFYNPTVLTDDEMPSSATSLFTALFPIILIFIAIGAEQFLNDGLLKTILVFVGSPVMAMLLSVLLAIYTLGIKQGKKMKAVMEVMVDGVKGITMILLVIAGAGALKQILIDSGVSDYIASLLEGSNFSPILLAWLIATAIRVCVGSATVAGLTAAGIVLPLASAPGVHAELLVLAIGSGSLMLSHVNDSGFWLFKEYFNLSVNQTLRTWTVMETIVGIMGLLGTLLLSTII
ncbi:idonate transporter [Croceivirga lutea]|uniref:gluconate:H+ symporter n=1 Tax=Croceivirga lutea TaxID=1775167 RepID=UPI001639FAD6|nr:gluconate:H+ symporter [Croceivirga lutea]GGG47744.1 idonate transporter [Croceivirga lutea]